MNTTTLASGLPLASRSSLGAAATALGAAVLLALATRAKSEGPKLTPLTKVAPTEAELAAFAATAVGAIVRLRESGQLSPASAQGGGSPVVHVVGASGVESAVDWAPLCAVAAAVVLVGPEAEAQLAGGGGAPCVTAVKALYSRSAVGDAVGAGSPLASPDVVLALNCDLYHIQWRRSLANLLRLRVPVVATFYCQFEGAAIGRLFKWSELEFAPAALAQSDAVVRDAHGAGMAKRLESAAAAAAAEPVPEARTLWRFSPNPHADAPPRECYSGTTHGVRNAYWMAFAGESAAANRADL